LLIRLLTSHIDWHLDAGLAIVFAEDVADVAAHNPVSGKSTQHCYANCSYADAKSLF
jgi:iron transport multicopper oxidase